MRARLVLVGTVSCLLVGSAIWLAGSADTQAAPVKGASLSAPVPSARPSALATPPTAGPSLGGGRVLTLDDYEKTSKYGRLPESLRGIQVNWNVGTDAHGKLVVSEDLGALFEFFLSTQSEEGTVVSIGRIEEYLQALLPGAAAGEALDILRAYIDYKKTLTRFEPPKDRVYTGDPKLDLITTIGDVKHALNARIQARRDYLGSEVASALFAADEAYDLYTLRRLEIEQNDALTAADKEALLTQAQAQLPEERRNRIQRERQEATLNQRIESLRAQGGSDEQIFAVRAEVLGADEATRLAVIDREHAAWMRRLQQYRAAKDSVLRLAGLTVEAKRQRIDELERASFNAEELMEVRILESIRLPGADLAKQG